MRDFDTEAFDSFASGAAAARVLADFRAVRPVTYADAGWTRSAAGQALLDRIHAAYAANDPAPKRSWRLLLRRRRSQSR